MSIEILDCLKRKRDICAKAVITSQNTAFMLTPAVALKMVFLQFACTCVSFWPPNTNSTQVQFNLRLLATTCELHRFGQSFTTGIETVGLQLIPIRLRFIGLIWIWITDRRSLRSYYIKRTDESTLGKDSLAL